MNKDNSVNFIEAGFDDDGESAILNNRKIMPIYPIEGLTSFSISNLYYVENNQLTINTEHNDKPYDINLPASAVRFLVCRIPPINELIAELNNPSVTTAQEFVNNVGMHRTPSLDYFYVAKGAVTLYMGNGEEHPFVTGDAFTIKGSDHAWVNYGDCHCELVGMMIGISTDQ